jgi:hypothetical protein
MLLPKWGLCSENLVVQFLAGKYLSNQLGDLASPHICGSVLCW